MQGRERQIGLGLFAAVPKLPREVQFRVLVCGVVVFAMRIGFENENSDLGLVAHSRAGSRDDW